MTESVRTVIGELSRLGKTMLIVTRDMRLAREISTRVLYLDKGVACDDDQDRFVVYPEAHGLGDLFRLGSDCDRG